MEVLLSLLPGNWKAYLVIAATVVAGASALAKMLETIVAALSVLWPNAAKANGFLNKMITVIGTIQALPLLQGLALSPQPGAPSHPVTVVAAPGGASVALPVPQ